MNVDVSTMLVVVRLNCGEPVSVSISNPDLAEIPVVFLETGEMADDDEESIVVGDYEILIKSDTVRHEELEELQDQIEDAGIVF
jgi:hypothetical protein